MVDFTKFLTSDLETVEEEIHNYNIKKIENVPLRYTKGSGKKRVVFIRKVNARNLEIVWSYEEYN